MKIVFAGDFIPTKDVTIDPILRERIMESDFAFVNLETPLTRSDNPITKNGNNFKADPDLINKVTEFGFSGVTLANNHIRDFGDQGVLDTINLCQREGLHHVGAGKNINNAKKPLRLEKVGLKISIINVAEKEFNIAAENRAGAAPYDTVNIFYAIQEEKKHSDKIIVVYHGGVEYIKHPAPYIVKEFKFMIDAGADAIVSHHTHRYSGVIQYNNRPILFGLGNFFLKSSIRNQPVDWYRSVIAVLRINNERIDFSLIPTQFNSDDERIEKLTTPEVEEVHNDIEKINETIQDPSKLNQTWNEYISQYKINMFSALKSSSRNEYRIRKRLPASLTNLTKYQYLFFENLFRCEAHRQKYLSLFKLLENDD